MPWNHLVYESMRLKVDVGGHRSELLRLHHSIQFDLHDGLQSLSCQIRFGNHIILPLASRIYEVPDFELCHLLRRHMRV